MSGNSGFIRWFERIDNQDVPLVGGKNASLGEMIGTLKAEGIRVPDGFATTAETYRKFLTANGLDSKIHDYIRAFQHRITSYNVCYTKLLRPERLRL